ncbi:MAG: type II secretion system protein GspK [Mariprofundaceae bacterium]
MKSGRGSRGIVLVIVLWVLVLLTVIASGFVFDIRTESRTVDASVDLAKAAAYVDAGLYRGLYELHKSASDSDRWQADGRPHHWHFDDVEITTGLFDLAGRIDLNKGNDALLLGAFQVAGLDAVAAKRLLHVIQDWRDGDELVRAFGAEARDYKRADLEAVPANAPFTTLSELKNVMGMTHDLYKRLEPMLTVRSLQTWIYAPAASRDVLMAVPGLSGDQVDDYLEMRGLAIEHATPLPILNIGQDYIARYLGRSYAIKVEVLMPEGLKSAREIVVRKGSGDPEHFSIIGMRAAWL